MVTAGKDNAHSFCRRRSGLGLRIWLSVSRRIVLMGCLLVFLMGGLPDSARADSLDTIIGFLTDAQILDPSIKDAKPLIECMIHSPPESCVNIKSIAEQQGKAAVKNYTPQDPTVKTAVEVVKAAYNKQWLKVLELTSTDLLVKIACKAGLSATGPIGNFLCSSISGEIAKAAKPVVKAAMDAIANNNWPKLVAVLGPGLACHLEIIPSVVRQSVCGPIGEILAAGKEIAEGLGETLVSVGGAVYDAWKNEAPKQSPQKHFQTWWVPELHRAGWNKFVKGEPAFTGVVNTLYNYCKQYYDSAKPCEPMKKLFVDAVNPAVNGLKSAAPAYYDVTIAPNLFYHYLFYVSSKGQYLAFPSSCPGELAKKYPLPAHPTSDPGVGVFHSADPQPSLWKYACNPAEAMLKNALIQNKAKFDQKLASLAKQGCALTSTSVLNCGTYEGYGACQKELPGHENVCALVQQPAAQKLAADIVKKLGTKRCAAGGFYQTSVECTRPWKQQECQALAAPYNKSSLNVKVQCDLKNDPAFNSAKQQATDVINLLNSGTWTPPLISGANADAMSIKFKPASCKPSWDPVGILCDEKDVVAQLATKVPAVNLKPCSADPAKDGADSPCYWEALSMKLAANPTVVGGAKLPIMGGPASDDSPKPPFTARGAEPQIARGKLPPVVASGRAEPSKGEAAAAPVKMAPPGAVGVATAPVVTAGLADLAHGLQVTIGGQPVSGAVVNIDASAAQSANKNDSGLCEFAIKHSARNSGSAATGPFDSIWTNSAVPGSLNRSWPPLGPGESREETDLVNLKSGQNILSLTLDSLNKVNESNEQNNQFRMIVNVSGNCGAAAAPPQRGLSPASPPVVPGDQRQQPVPIPPAPRRLPPPGR